MITIAGKPCSGKSAISKELVKDYGFERFSMGDMFRSIAKEYKMDVNELNQHCTSPNTNENYINIDAEIDKKVKDLGCKRIRDYVIIETRTGFIFIPESHKVYTTILPAEQARRLINSGRDTENTNVTVEQAIVNMNAREEMEHKRFLYLYGQNNLDMRNYDYVLDTTHLTIEEGSQAVFDSYLEYRKRKYGIESPEHTR